MIYMIKGKVALIKKDSIVLDNNGIGYRIYVSHKDDYKIDEEITLYTYEVTREDSHFLIGFLSLAEKAVFLALNGVKGIGPKTSIIALSGTTPERLKEAINSHDLAYLKQLPGIGGKAASQILLDLEDSFTDETPNASSLNDAHDALVALGFKSSQVKKVLSQIHDNSLSVEEIIKLSLTMMKK